MKFPIAFMLTASFIVSANAANIDNGDDLHMTDCTGCHESTVYTRENRRVQNLPRLGKQVRICRDNLGITWVDDEVEDVIHYLDQSYYHF